MRKRMLAVACFVRTDFVARGSANFHFTGRRASKWRVGIVERLRPEVLRIVSCRAMKTAE